MAHDVFISYSFEDKEVADIACEALKMVGIRCWIAPRDIRAGVPYAEAIIEAIDSSRLIVLIFSAAANDSPQVMREANRAVGQKIPILPFRIENVRPTKSMDFYIGPSHWLDAFEPPLAKHVVQLARAVLEELGTKPEVPDVPMALAAVDAAVEELGRSSHAIDLDGVGQVIATAIHFGAPIYNDGSPAGCAKIYLHAGRGILRILDQVTGQSAAKPCFERLMRARAELRKVVSLHETVTSQNANPFAWALRRAFDHIMLLAVVERGIREVDNLLDRTKASGQPLQMAQLCEVLRTAMSNGNILHQASDLEGCAELHLHTARAVLSQPALPRASNGAGLDDPVLHERERLKSIIGNTTQVTGENAERLAWALYEAFLAILGRECP